MRVLAFFATLGCPSGRPFSAWSAPTWSTTMHDVLTPEFEANEIRKGNQEERDRADPNASRGEAMVDGARAKRTPRLRPPVSRRRRWRAPKRIGRLDGHMSRTGSPTATLDKTFSKGKPDKYNLLMAATLCAGHVYIIFGTFARFGCQFSTRPRQLRTGKKSTRWRREHGTGTAIRCNRRTLPSCG